MVKPIHYIYSMLVAGLACMCAGLLSCTQETGGDGPLPEADASLAINLGTVENELTKAGGDANAREGEFINSLCIFVVDAQNRIQKKWMLADGAGCWDIDNKQYAPGSVPTDPKGNIIRWVSDEVPLPAGQYTIYAFANWETVENTDWKALIEGDVPATIDPAKLDAILLEDPATRLNQGGAYIPMSAQKAVSLTRKAQTERIELVRTVGRVEVTLTNNRTEAVAFSKFTMGNFAHEVGLMDAISVRVPINKYVKEFPDGGINVAPGIDNNTLTFSFYVNETQGSSSNFAIVMEDTDGKKYTGMSGLANIARNHIFPLTLTLSDDSWEFQVLASISPIGGYPVVVDVTPPTLTTPYAVTLPEGCHFKMMARKAGTQDDYQDCTLSATQGGSDVAIIGPNGIWAHLESLPGQSGEMQVSPPGTTLDYPVTITTEALKDWDDYTVVTQP